MSSTKPDYPQPPAQIAYFVDVLGVDLTVRFILRFGGAEVYFSKHPKQDTELIKLIGRENVIALSDLPHSHQARVPLMKPWTSRYLHAQGKSVSEIARTVRSSDLSVRRWLSADQKPKRKPPQASDYRA